PLPGPWDGWRVSFKFKSYATNNWSTSTEILKHHHSLVLNNHLPCLPSGIVRASHQQASPEDDSSFPARSGNTRSILAALRRVWLGGRNGSKRAAGSLFSSESQGASRLRRDDEELIELRWSPFLSCVWQWRHTGPKSVYPRK